MAVRRNLVTCRHLEAEQERAFLSGIAVKQRSLCSRRQGSRACTPGDFVGRCDVVRAAGRALRRRGAGGKGERTRRDRENKLFHRSEEHTSEHQSLMRNSYAVFCLKKTKNKHKK